MKATIYNTMLTQAHMFAFSAHAAVGQLRKHTLMPYIVHPEEVVQILILHNITDPYILSAAYMHDVIEDTKVTEADLRRFFPTKVVDLVLEVTDVSKPEDGNREKRKAIDRAHIAEISDNGKLIKCADLISNTRDIIAHDQNFAKIYLKEKKLVLDVMKDAIGNTSIFAEASIYVER